MLFLCNLQVHIIFVEGLMETQNILNSFHFDGQQFLEGLVTELYTIGLDLADRTIDHLCYRVQSEQQYESLKSGLAEIGTLLTEANVNGRPISTYRLHKPFKYQTYSINLVELPAPKEGMHYELGFEHAEVVVRQHLPDFEKQYPHLKFQYGGNKNTNHELSFKTKVGQVKFHCQPLDRIIEVENSNITDILFDFDGTLIRSRENIYEINSIVFSKALGRQVTVTEAKEKFFTEFSKLFNAFEVTCPKAQAHAILSWGEVSAQFSYNLFDGVVDALNYLRGKKYNLHLWTARDQQSATKILEQHELSDFFNTASFANEIDSKPHPNSLNFQYRDQSKNSVLVIGDSPSDIIGAKSIGAISAGALWDPHSNPNALVSHGADLLFYETGEFISWLKDRSVHG